MSDMNQCLFTGRLGADPEIKSTQRGDKVANLRLAVSDQWRDKSTGERKERTTWVSVVIWSEGLVRVCESYLRKGSRILVQGALQTREWEDQQGQKRFSTEVVLQGFNSVLTMLDGPGEKSGGRGSDEAPRQSRERGSRLSDADKRHRDEAFAVGDDFGDEIPF